jgi:hypothetical protein
MRAHLAPSSLTRRPPGRSTWLVSSRLDELVRATPATRDRYVDFLRAASIVAVVFGAVPVAHDGVLRRPARPVAVGRRAPAGQHRCLVVAPSRVHRALDVGARRHRGARRKVRTARPAFTRNVKPGSAFKFRGPGCRFLSGDSHTRRGHRMVRRAPAAAVGVIAGPAPTRRRRRPRRSRSPGSSCGRTPSRADRSGRTRLP